MAGLQVREGPDKGVRIKKPSSMTASSPELVFAFHNLRCNGRHRRVVMMGHSEHLKQAETWTWTEANMILEGIKAILRAMGIGES